MSVRLALANKRRFRYSSSTALNAHRRVPFQITFASDPIVILQSSYSRLFRHNLESWLGRGWSAAHLDAALKLQEWRSGLAAKNKPMLLLAVKSLVRCRRSRISKAKRLRLIVGQKRDGGPKRVNEGPRRDTCSIARWFSMAGARFSASHS